MRLLVVKILQGSCKPVVVFIVFLVSFNAAAQDLIPLGIKNYWRYRQVVTDSGKVLSVDTVLNEVKEVLSIKGDDWYLLNEFGYDFIVRNTYEGQVEIDTFSVDSDGSYKEIAVFKKPDGGKDLSYVVDGLNRVSVSKSPVTLNTGAGDFICYRYTIITEGVNDEMIETYICPSVGIVYQDWTMGTKHIKSELIDYEVE